MWLVQSRSECFFGEGNNVFTIEDILEMCNVDEMRTEAARYNTRIRYHYIAWDIKIRLDILNEAKNGFTWMNCFTQGSHKMAKACILK